MASFFFFYEVEAAVWPREFNHGNEQSSKIPVATPRFPLHYAKKKTSFDSPWYDAFAVVYSSFVTLLYG